MKVKLLEGTKCPKQGREGDAGYDFFLRENVTLKAHQVTVIDTGVCVELPKGYAGLLASVALFVKRILLYSSHLLMRIIVAKFML